jgi:4-amino-4-deoxy-L-arabinose transferase-like glycosyltransferase
MSDSATVVRTLESRTGVQPRDGESPAAYVDRLVDEFDVPDPDRTRLDELAQRELFAADGALSADERRELDRICRRMVANSPAVDPPGADATSPARGEADTERERAVSTGGSSGDPGRVVGPEEPGSTGPQADGSTNQTATSPAERDTSRRAGRDHSPWSVRRPDVAYLLPLVVGSAFVFLFRLGDQTLQTWDEGFYGNLARHMVQDGYWIVPRMYYEIGLYPSAFEPWVRLPPLGLWLQALSMLAFGVNEFAVRFPSAAASLLTVVVVYLVGRSFGSRPSGFFAGLIYLTTPYVYSGFNAGRDGGLDALLVLFGTLFVATAWLAVERDEPRWLYPVGLFGGLALLTKGLGAGVFFLVALPLAFVGQNVFVSKEMGGATGLAALLTLPWPAYVYSAYGEQFVQQFLVSYVLERAAGEAFGTNTNTLFAFMDYPYIKELLFASDLFHPWSLMLFLALPAVAYRELFTDEAGSHLETGLLVWWILASFGLFVFIGNREWYIMPMYVPAAVLLGRRFEAAIRGSQIDIATLALGAVLVLALSPDYSIFSEAAGSVTRGTVLTLGTVLITWFSPLREKLTALFPEQSTTALARIAPTLVALVLIASLIGVPATPDAYAEQRALADEVNRNAPQSATVFVETGLGTAFHTFSFYAQRPLESGSVPDFQTSGARYAVLRAESLSRVQSNATVLMNTTVTGGQNVSLIEVER